MEKKEEDKLRSHLPASIVEFVRLVVNKMRYRKKVRFEVAKELTAHFEDELHDCRSDAEKQQKAQQLIAGFGDVQMLGVLLRRAKKRCRPLWRTIVARSFQTVGVLVLCLILYMVWFLSGKPVITTDYIAELNHFVRPVADESLNAAPSYYKAAKAVGELPDDISELLPKESHEVTLEQKQRMAEWLTKNEETLELVIAGSEKPYYWQEYQGEEMLSIVLPNLREYRNLVRAVTWRAQLRAEQGRYEDAFADLKSCYRFGQHLKGDKVLIEQLVAIAIEALSVQRLRSILSEHRIDSATLTMLQKDFEHMVAGEGFTMSLAAEKMFIYDEIQRCFTEDWLGGGHLYLSRMRTLDSIGDESAPSVRELIVESVMAPEAWPRAVRVLFFHPDKQQTRETADRVYAFCEVIAQKTPAQIRAEGIDIEEETMKIIEDNVLLAILTPAFGRACELGHRNRTTVQATITTIALLRYRADKGSYPEDLRQLITAGYLRQLPLDLYTDKPLVYRKTDDSFILYSLGDNFEDDGGKVGTDRQGRPRLWARDADAVFWPVPESHVKR
jgi:hypothetical protein